MPIHEAQNKIFPADAGRRSPVMRNGHRINARVSVGQRVRADDHRFCGSLSHIENAAYGNNTRARGNALTAAMSALLLLNGVNAQALGFASENRRRVSLAERECSTRHALPDLDGRWDAGAPFAAHGRRPEASHRLAYRHWAPERVVEQQAIGQCVSGGFFEGGLKRVADAIDAGKRWVSEHDVLTFPTADAAVSADTRAVNATDDVVPLTAEAGYRNLFPHYNALLAEYDALYALGKNKKDAFIQEGNNAIQDYYAQFAQAYPNLQQQARRLLQARIKARFNLDLDPDTHYFIHFSSAQGCKTAFTGWCHRGDVTASHTLTHYMFSNFPAKAQENIDSTNVMCGIYRTAPDVTADFGAHNDVSILPADFIALIWDIDFYQIAKSHYRARYQDIAVQSKKKFIDFILHLAKHRPDAAVVDDLLIGVGLKKGAHVAVSQFDMNGYKAANMFVFIHTHMLRVTLYMPYHEVKFLSFSNMAEMKSWIINNCADEPHRNTLASHFSLYNRQDGVLWAGVDRWLKTFSAADAAPAYRSKICADLIPLSSALFFDTMAALEGERLLSDINTEITSDAEVTRDIWLDYIEASNLLLNPCAPLLALGFDLEGAIMGDTEQQRSRDWNRVASDVINILLVVLVDKALKFGGEGNAFMGEMKNSIETGAFDAVYDNIFPRYDIRRLAIEKRMTIANGIRTSKLMATPELFNRIDGVATLDNLLFADATPNSRGIFHYTDAETQAGKSAINIDGKFYALTPGTIDGAYFLENGDEIVFYRDRYFVREATPESNIAYTACRVTRMPGSTCLHFSAGLKGILEHNLHNGMTREQVGQTWHYSFYHSLERNGEGKLFVRYQGLFYEVSENNERFMLYGKEKSGLLRKFRTRKPLAEFYFSPIYKTYYLNTPIEYKMETLGCSRAAAEFDEYAANMLFDRSQIAEDEINALKTYSGYDHKLINQYLLTGPSESAPAEICLPQIEKMRALLSKLPAYGGELYRGGSLSLYQRHLMQPGALIKTKKFLSTSACRTKAKAFESKVSGMFYTIHAVENRGHPVVMYTRLVPEAEVLFEEETLFRVAAVRQDEIELIELSADESKTAANVKTVIL